MNAPTAFASLLERFFIERLRQQRHVSDHTVAAYRDTFRLLFEFVQATRHKPPCRLELSDFDFDLISSFLNHIEQRRSNAVRTRNLRLTAEPGSDDAITPCCFLLYKRGCDYQS